MARIRDTYIEDQLTLADAGVRIVPINIVDPISELLIGVRATNFIQNKENYAHDVFTKIELVDGSDVLMSMDFKQLQAMHFYNRGVVPHMGIYEWGGGEQRAYQSLIFGRDAMDFDYAFDPTRFRNPQLRVTWNLAEIRAVDGTGFASGSGKLTVIARCIEQAPRRPGAFFMTKELYDWETAASGDEPIVMPTDYPWRMLMVRCYEAIADRAQPMFQNITDLKLSCDQDAYVPFQYHTRELLWMMEQWWGLCQTNGKYYADVGDWKPIFIGACPSGHLDLHTPAVHGGIQDIYGSWAQLYLDAGASGVIITCFGSGYHNTWCIPFGTPGTPEEWFEAMKHKSIRLLATQGNAGASASVVLQQVRHY